MVGVANEEERVMEPEEEIDPYVVDENLVDLVRRVTKKNWTLLVAEEALNHITEKSGVVILSY